MSEKAPGAWFEKGSGERTIVIGALALIGVGLVVG